MKKNKKIKKNIKPSKQITYRKIFTYVIIVNYGLGESVMQLLRKSGSNVQCDILGRGTANKEFQKILGMDNRKDVILAFVDEENVKMIKKDLSKFFSKNKYYMGVGFTMPLTSIVGEKIYHFLTNTI